jgi:hypothetical protein
MLKMKHSKIYTHQGQHKVTPVYNGYCFCFVFSFLFFFQAWLFEYNAITCHSYQIILIYENVDFFNFRFEMNI